MKETQVVGKEEKVEKKKGQMTLESKRDEAKKVFEQDVNENLINELYAEVAHSHSHEEKINREDTTVIISQGATSSTKFEKETLTSNSHKEALVKMIDGLKKNMLVLKKNDAFNNDALASRQTTIEEIEAEIEKLKGTRN